MDIALDELKEIKNYTKPKKRKTNKAQILRDPVPNTMLDDIIKSHKPKGAHGTTWARFQLTSVLLFFSGLRINEIACIKKEMIQSIIDQGQMDFYQSKVNKYRTIRFTAVAVNTIKDVFLKTEKIIFEHNGFLEKIKFIKNFKKYF